MAAKRWVTMCLQDTALHLPEDDLRTELGRWVQGKVLLPGCERGKLSPSHPYALFAFVPVEQAAAAWAARRCRLVEQVIREPILDRDLQRSLNKVGIVKVGESVRVADGALAGVEGVVVRCLKQALQIRVTLRSGDRTVWVRRWEVAPS